MVKKRDDLWFANKRIEEINKKIKNSYLSLEKENEKENNYEIILHLKKFKDYREKLMDGEIVDVLFYLHAMHATIDKIIREEKI
ncbi:hypothetical protein Bp8pS_016 [Bacillus phage vB_BpuM-BpSp]|nr:hypothetical protein Bp8pS_016 [Bacillus phage vB_BpuM-BpSp]